MGGLVIPFFKLTTNLKIRLVDKEMMDPLFSAKEHKNRYTSTSFKEEIKFS